MDMMLGAEPEITWQAGATLAPYRLISRIALGVRAEIWQAKITGAEGFEKAIALKTMRPSASRMPELVRMFNAEAAIAAHLYHPNIVQLVDCGQIADRHYMAMEFVDGLTLRQVMQRLRDLGHAFPVRLLVHIAVQACNALHYAHELYDGDGWLGFLHRDLNPDNLMIAPTGAAKIIDFGAARMASTTVARHPFGGDVNYAAPERIRGLAEDRRGDIYSLGVMLYEAAVGVLPYGRGTNHDVVPRVLQGKPWPPQQLAPEVPDALAAIILKAMALVPADRHPSAQLLSADLQAFIDDLPAAPDRADSVTAALNLIFHGAQQDPARISQVRERFAPDAYDSHEEVTSLSGPSPYPPSDRQDDGETVVDSSKPPAWLFQPSPSLPVVPDIFPAPHPTPAAKVPGADSRFGANGFSSPDVFAIRRGGTPTQLPVVTIEPEAAVPTQPPPPLSPQQAEAARCFDRGLAHVADKNYALAEVDWQRATELDPDNRLYRTNLKRLTRLTQTNAQIEGRGPAPTTETP